MKRLILDTNIVSAYLKGHPMVVPKAVAYYQHFGEIDISVITYYEILKGLYHRDAKGQLRGFQQFLSYCRIHDLGLKSAAESAGIASYLLRIGREDQTNTDVLIAGIALSLEFGVCTNNERDFQNIPGLLMENSMK